MKKIFLFFILISALNVEAQYMNGRGNSQRQQRQRQMTQAPQKAPEPNFKVEEYIGLVFYDLKKTLKKTSVKKSTEKGRAFSKLLTSYNKSIRDMARINSFLLKNTKIMVEGFQKRSMKNGDFSEQPKVLKKLNENLKPISNFLKDEDLKLNTKLKVLLSIKQYKNWIKYNKKLNKRIPKQ
jgi:hypothetical protein